MCYSPLDCWCYGMFVFFFFNDTATTEIYTLSLHDALPISGRQALRADPRRHFVRALHHLRRSEEHTSELQSRSELVCRLLLEKKKQKHLIIFVFKTKKKKKKKQNKKKKK